MYISCPECDTKFVVTYEQIGKHGRKVKCSKCFNIWHQTSDHYTKIEPVAPAPTAVTPLGNGVNLPALLPIKIPVYLYILPVFFLMLISLMFVVIFPEKFNIDSLAETSGLTIEDVSIKHLKEIDKITVSYKVLNSSKDHMKMPLIRIRLCDNNGRILKSYVDERDVKLAPQQMISIRTEFAPPPAKTHSVDIMLGGRMDFWLH
ncbi:MAG: zinc-ribbon domain-containing protein [Rickettsiaceae bacterium]|nr:zinc-ribbon domain-containing protein [Rickettsiaceae bacterium]